MKLTNIIIKSLCISSLYTLVISCSLCKDNLQSLYIKKEGGPVWIDIIEGPDDYASVGATRINYFKSRYKKIPSGQVVKKTVNLFDTDENGNEFIWVTFPEELYSAYLFGSFKKNNMYLNEHTVVVYGKISDRYIQTQEVTGSMDSVKVKRIDVCNNNFHGKMQITDKAGKSLYKTKFKNGTGYWKDFYYVNTTTYPIKEEGQVKNNYKSGKWTYYNPEGQIDSVKVYTQTDSVDVRFPHCLLNKTEPCY